jgi:hypothetical protein
MGRDRAAYMRDYRARRGGGVEAPADPTLPQLLAKIEELEGEVHRLKQQLAARSASLPPPRLGSFNSQPFSPVPKVPSRSR